MIEPSVVNIWRKIVVLDVAEERINWSSPLKQQFGNTQREL